MDIFVYQILYIFTQNNASIPWEKHERNNEQCKQNLPLQILWSGSIKYQNQPNICGKNRSRIRSYRFLD